MRLFLLTFKIAMFVLHQDCNAQRVTLEGRNFMLNGAQFYPMVMNYRTQMQESYTMANPPNQTCYPGPSYSSPPEEWYNAPHSEGAHGINYSNNAFGNDCGDPIVCLQIIRSHFQKIRASGFNTIRLLRMPYINSDGIDQVYNIAIRGRCTNFWVEMFYDLENYQNATALKYFELIEEVLDVAHEEDLKVIFLCADPGSTPDSAPSGKSPVFGETEAEKDASAAMYADWLYALASNLQGHPALMAYDLWNEPGYVPGMYSVSKYEACKYSKLWYDAMKTADPEALVTMGLVSLDDMFLWDPSVIKVDFASPHVYPYFSWLDNNDYTSAVHRTGNIFHYIGQAYPIPWLIGETGFRADDGPPIILPHYGQIINNDPALHQPPFMDGSEAQQQQFAEYTLAATRSNKGSGYSWWYFQNGKKVSAVNAYNDPEGYRNQFWGIIKYCPTQLCDLMDPSRDKLVVGTFQNYSVPSMPANLPPTPAGYNDWLDLAPNVAHVGQILDENDNPVTNGIVTASWIYYPNSLLLEEDEEIDPFGFAEVTMTDDLGFYTVHTPPNNLPWDVEQIFLPPVRYQLRQTSPGGVYELYDYTDDGWPQLSSLSIQNLPDELIVSNLAISSWYHGLARWRLRLTDVQILANNEFAEFNARESITIQPGFHAAFGSVVHVLPKPTFMECIEDNWKASPEGPETVEEKNSELGTFAPTVRLQFMKPTSCLQVFPNPVDAFMTIHSTCDGIIIVSDNLGKEFLKYPIRAGDNVISMSSAAPGAYTIRFIGGMNIAETHTFIKAR